MRSDRWVTRFRLRSIGAWLCFLLQTAPATVRWFVQGGPTVAAIAGGARVSTLSAGLCGAVHALTGATQLVTNPATPRAVVGVPFTLAFAIVGAPSLPGSYEIRGVLPPGMAIPGRVGDLLNGFSGTLTGTPTAAGDYPLSFRAWLSPNKQGKGGDFVFSLPLLVVAAPTIALHPSTHLCRPGERVEWSAVERTRGALRYEWFKNGSPLPTASGSTLSIENVQPTDAGLYTVRAVYSDGAFESAPAMLGILSESKVVGHGREVGTNIRHPNGNVYDQILLTGAGATISADSGQITRVSFLDLNDDIVQAEFGGAGNLSIVLESASGPALPRHFNQDVLYMKGHACLVVAGGNESTYLSLFTVGKLTAVDPTGSYDSAKPPSATNDPATNGSPLFKKDTIYDGIADAGVLAIANESGKMGGVFLGNAEFFRTHGRTGIYAPAVAVSQSVRIGDISARDRATPVLVLGASELVSVHGGNLYQENGQAIQTEGLSVVAMLPGVTSHNFPNPARMNAGVLQRDGTDITASVIRNPQP